MYFEHKGFGTYKAWKNYMACCFGQMCRAKRCIQSSGCSGALVQLYHIRESSLSPQNSVVDVKGPNNFLFIVQALW